MTWPKITIPLPLPETICVPSRDQRTPNSEPVLGELKRMLL